MTYVLLLFLRDCLDVFLSLELVDVGAGRVPAGVLYNWVIT